MKQLTLIILIFVTAGCTNTQDWAGFWNMEDDTSNPTTSTPNMNVVDVKADRNRQAELYALQDNYVPARSAADSNRAQSSVMQYGDSEGSYQGEALNKHIGDYVQVLTQDLVSNMDGLNQKTAIGITHFALIDSDLKTTNLLGFQLAESFIHEFHKFRIPVIDYKATDYIRVTETGDFLLSRDFIELTNEVPIDYILTGTLTRHQGGYLVNARILGLNSKAVKASAQMFLPFSVVDALLPSSASERRGMNIIRG